MPSTMYDPEKDELVAFDLDQLIARLQHIRRKMRRSIPVRYADGKDQAYGILGVSLEKNANWEGEPENEVYVALS